MPTALIIDDEPEANRLLSRIVQLRGFQSVAAFTGAEAEKALAAQRPDIIFLDLMLPDVSGHLICENLKARRQTYTIPVVMITARLANENRVQSYRHGADVFIPKPYMPDQIFEALRCAPVWRDRAATSPSQGQISLQGGDEAAAHEAIARLWGVLLDRTSWDEDAVHRLIIDIGQWAHDVFSWARMQPVRRLAALGYDVAPDEVVVAIEDQSGWSAEVDRGRLAPPGRFDEVTMRDDGCATFRVRPR
jgi:CheY-like chemotaxis protein